MIQLYTMTDGTRPSYSQQVLLDGRLYGLSLAWQSRVDRWALSLYTQAGDPIVRGRMITVGTDLLAGCVSAERPRGLLIVLPLDGVLLDPGLQDLGTNSALYYYSEGESPGG